MLLRRRRTADPIADDREVVVEHGPSLAKGPALIAGSVLVAFGLASLLKNNDFPSFSSSFPDGTAQGTSFLGFEVNGWTAFFSITAGALLLFGAAQHHLAKLMSLLVGLALAACAVIALIDGQDVFGLAAANGWTKLGFAVAGGVLLLNALMPRTTRRREVATTAPAATAAADDDAPRRRFARPARDSDPVAAAGEPRTTAIDRDEAPTTVGTRPAAGETAADANADADAPTTTHRRI